MRARKPAMTFAAATHPAPTQGAAPGTLDAVSVVTSPAARTVLVVASIGHLVPRAGFEGHVHSVFARACNLACGDALLTLGTFDAGNGPTVLRLAPGAPADLRDRFEIGERFDARRGTLRTSRVELDLRQASVWHPAEPGHAMPAARVEARLRKARLQVDARRATRANVLDTLARPALVALADACRALDCGEALRQLDRLVGWGEGLTPAGDDFLVGLLAGLDVLVRGDGRRRRFQRAIRAGVASRTHRTTPIAAHCLRLAAAGHHAEPLVELRSALVCAVDDDGVETALQRALAVGATSGADTVSGLLAGLLAWLPSSPIAAAP